MPELRINANKSARIRYDSDGVTPGTNFHGETYATELASGLGALLLGFPYPSGVGNKKITGLEFHAFVIPPRYSVDGHIVPAGLIAYALLSSWGETTATWNNKPNKTSLASLYTTRSNLAAGSHVQSDGDVTKLDDIKSIFEYGLWVNANSFSYTLEDNTSVATNHAGASLTPYLVLKYSDDPVHTTIASRSPTSGQYPKFFDTTFQWSVKPTGDSLDPPTLSNVKFRWRPYGEEEYTEIDCGTSLSYTVPGDTFTTDRVQWQIVITDSYGYVEESSWLTIWTNDVPYPVEILSPKNEIVDGSQDIPIRFKVDNSTGRPPKTLRFSYLGDDDKWWGWTVNGSSWADWSVAGVTRVWTMRKANATHLPIGEMQISIEVLNSDETARTYAWSTFIRVAAPDAPSVSVDAAPRATVRWQASGQVAYRVTLDGVVYGPYFGATNAFTSPELLSDGQHTAAVEVQGEYGLWSEPGSYSFAVENQPVGTLLLDGSFGLDAYLSLAASWNGPYDFWIYRDEKRIARTGAELYTDRLALSEHEYQVFAVFASGNYTASNRVTGTAVCQSMAITPAEEESVWLMLETSASSDRAESYSYSKTHSLRHFLGAEYPVLEESTFADLSGSFEAAFMNKEQADAFWALRGKVVILKARDEVMVGLLANVRKTRTHYLHSFSFELQQIDWEGLDA